MGCRVQDVLLCPAWCSREYVNRCSGPCSAQLTTCPRTASAVRTGPVHRASCACVCVCVCVCACVIPESVSTDTSLHVQASATSRSQRQQWWRWTAAEPSSAESACCGTSRGACRTAAGRSSARTTARQPFQQMCWSATSASRRAAAFAQHTVSCCDLSRTCLLWYLPGCVQNRSCAMRCSRCSPTAVLRQSGGQLRLPGTQCLITHEHTSRLPAAVLPGARANPLLATLSCPHCCRHSTCVDLQQAWERERAHHTDGSSGCRQSCRSCVILPACAGLSLPARPGHQ